MWISVVTRIGGIIEIGISDKQFTSEMNNVHPTTSGGEYGTLVRNMVHGVLR